MDQCGSVWLDVYGLIWLGLGQCGSVCFSVTQCGSGSNVAWCGSVWLSVDQFGSVWVGVYGLIWLGVGQFGCGSVWVRVGQCGSVWISVGQCIWPNRFGVG